jgi:hypothetical protein
METLQHTLYNIIGTIEYNVFIEIYDENLRNRLLENEVKKNKHKNYDPDENISICRDDSNVNDDMIYISTDILRDSEGHDPYKPLNIYNGTPGRRLNRDLRATLPINELKDNPPSEGCPILNLHRCKPRINTKKKSVSFGEVHGYYIPSRRELFQLVNKSDIWWSQTDFINMRLTASNEVQEFIRQNPVANYKICVKQLWTILDFDAIYAKLAEQRQVL